MGNRTEKERRGTHAGNICRGQAKSALTAWGYFFLSWSDSLSGDLRGLYIPEEENRKGVRRGENQAAKRTQKTKESRGVAPRGRRVSASVMRKLCEATCAPTISCCRSSEHFWHVVGLSYCSVVQ